MTRQAALSPPDAPGAGSRDVPATVHGLRAAPKRKHGAGAYQPKRGHAGLTYLGVYEASPAERIALIKRGIPASEAKRIIADLTPLRQGATLKALNISIATINKKAKQRHPLSPAESERVIGIARLVGQVQTMVQESGNPEGFDAAAWMSRWLEEPLPALGGVRPIDLMDTMEGQAVVSTALAQMQAGAYA